MQYNVPQIGFLTKQSPWPFTRSRYNTDPLPPGDNTTRDSRPEHAENKITSSHRRPLCARLIKKQLQLLRLAHFFSSPGITRSPESLQCAEPRALRLITCRLSSRNRQALRHARLEHERVKIPSLECADTTPAYKMKFSPYSANIS